MSRRGYIKSPVCLSRRNYIESLVCLSHLCRDKRIIRRPNKLGDIHLNLSIKHLLFFVKKQLLCPVIFLHRTIFMPFADTRIAVRVTSTCQTTRPSAPPYNTTDDSPVRPGHRFMRPHRFTTRRITCSSAPVYNTAAGSTVCSHGRLAHDGFQLHYGDRQTPRWIFSG